MQHPQHAAAIDAAAAEQWVRIDAAAAERAAAAGGVDDAAAAALEAHMHPMIADDVAHADADRAAALNEHAMQLIAEGDAGDAVEADAAAVADPAAAAAPDDVASCKICFEAVGVLFQPCMCRGSSYVHSACLQEWRKQAHDPHRCNVCGYAYRTVRSNAIYRFIGSTIGAALCSGVLIGGALMLLHRYVMPRRSYTVLAFSDGVSRTIVGESNAAIAEGRKPLLPIYNNIFGSGAGPTPMIVMPQNPLSPISAEELADALAARIGGQPLPTREASMIPGVRYLRMPAMTDIPSPLMDSLSRIAAMISMLTLQKNPWSGDADLLRAMLTSSPANPTQAFDVQSQTIFSLITLWIGAGVLWKKRAARWLATTPEIVLPYREG